MSDQIIFTNPSIRDQIIDNVRVAYGYLTRGPTVAFEIIVASERTSDTPSSHRQYHGYVVFGRKNNVFIYSPRKDRICEVYRSLFEASAEVVQLLIDEGRFADPELEQSGTWFGDSWVDLGVKYGDDFHSRSASSLGSEKVEPNGDGAYHLLSNEENARCPLTAVNHRDIDATANETNRVPSYDEDRKTQNGSDFEEYKDEYRRTSRSGDGVSGIESDRVRAKGESGLNAPNDEQDLADDEGEWSELRSRVQAWN